MKNTYLMGYFPLISLILFSLSFAVYAEMEALQVFKKIGIYEGMREFFSDAGIKLALLIVLLLVFFMLFAALKLISDTVLELSLLFFSKDSEGEALKSIRLCSVIYLIGGCVSLLSISSIFGITAIFIGTTLIAFIYFVYKISPTLTGTGLSGIIFFHTIIWSVFMLVIVFSLLKLYNSIMASLPL